MSDTSNLPMAVEPAADKAPIPALPRIKTSPAIKRFNDCVVTALGSAQRDWLLSVKGLDGPPVSEEAEAAENVGEPYDAASRALTLYNPFAGLFGLDSLSTAELNNALAQMSRQSPVETDPADLEAALDSFISR